MAVEYEQFLKRHDPYWTQLPKCWDESAFLGNGMIGAAIYGAEHKSHRQTIRFVMGREDVTANRPHQYAARIPVGEFQLQFEGWIYGGTTARIDLWNAELQSSVVTINGTAQIRAAVHSLADVMCLEIRTEKEKESFHFVPYPEIPQALLVDDGRPNVDQYFPQIEIWRETRGEIEITRQRYNRSQDGCTAALLRTAEPEKPVRYYVSIQNGCDEAAVERAIRLLQEESRKPPEEFWNSHQEWWHRYYSKSFLSIPDTRLEGFYWIQMYKLGSATRPDSPTLDNQGPWTGPTPWPGTWFNMNVQVAYSPVYTSNHLEQGESLCRALDRNMPHLIENVPEEFRTDSAGIGRSMSHDFCSAVGDEKGNLLWACHNYYRQYRYSMDDNMLRQRLYPLLRRAVNFHVHLLREDQDGKLHFPPSISPEYGSFKQLTVEDCNYDLFLLRWGLLTLLEIVKRLELEDTQENKWREVLSRLTDPPFDETGYLIGRGVRMEHGHRHYSHMLGVSPLHIVDCENPSNRQMIYTSLKHWFYMEGDLRGFTFSGASSIFSAIGDGDHALSCLLSGLCLCKPNTFYREAGPVIESPLGMAEALHDMLLQSHNGVVHIFPALPSAWRDVSFQDLRAEGAFLVSVQMRGGKMEFIRIHSLMGEPLRLRCDALRDKRLYLTVGGEQKQIFFQDKILDIPLKKGQDAVLSRKKNLDVNVCPVKENLSQCSFWGGNKPWRMYDIPFSL